MTRSTIVLFFALILPTDAHPAEVTGDHKVCGVSPCAYVNGEITSGDLVKLKSVFDSATRRRSFDVLNQEIFTLQLNSRGGRLEEAMEIGRWVRKNRISTSMPMNSECFSSCVYVLAAGIAKQVFHEMWGNKVGIHRPYLTRMPKESIQNSMRKALADSKAYFAEMNLPEQLADAMFSVSPDDVEILTDEKLSTYRLTGLDMVFEEELQLKTAALYGMTRQEYMQNRRLFETEAKTKCYPLGGDEGLRCIQGAAKRHGLHESQMRPDR